MLERLQLCEGKKWNNNICNMCDERKAAAANED
jgi:hypothetical protein